MWMGRPGESAMDSQRGDKARARQAWWRTGSPGPPFGGAARCGAPRSIPLCRAARGGIVLYTFKVRGAAQRWVILRSVAGTGLCPRGHPRLPRRLPRGLPRRRCGLAREPLGSASLCEKPFQLRPACVITKLGALGTDECVEKSGTGTFSEKRAKLFGSGR